MKFSGVTILQGVEFSIFPIDFEWALQQCSATALPVIIIIIITTTITQWNRRRSTRAVAVPTRRSLAVVRQQRLTLHRNYSHFSRSFALRESNITRFAPELYLQFKLKLDSDASVLFCYLAVLDPRVGHTMDVLYPFIYVLCHSDWLFHG